MTYLDAMLDVLNILDVAAFGYGTDGEVIGYNETAATLLGSALRLNGTHLTADDGIAAAAFAALAAAYRTPAASCEAHLPFRVVVDNRPCLLIRPIGCGAERVQNYEGLRGLVFVERLGIATCWPHVEYRTAYKLTEAQAKILRQLLAGHRGVEIAANNGLKEPTVRHHLTGLRSKIGAEHQVDLMAKVVRLSPLQLPWRTEV